MLMDSAVFQSKRIDFREKRYFVDLGIGFSRLDFTFHAGSFFKLGIV